MTARFRHSIFIHLFAIIGFVAGTATQSFAEDTTAEQDECLVQSLKAAEPNTSAEEIKLLCNEPDANESPLESRLIMEEKNTGNQFAITPHKPNYFLPLSYNTSPNEEPFADQTTDTDFDNNEVLFQLSMKIALWKQILGHRTNLFMAYTGRSWWQAYNRDTSSQFRETNHEPELFLSFDPHWSLGGWEANYLTTGFVHQSNGQNLPLSRSWNRIYISAAIERNDWVFALKPWYRIPDDEKNSPDDAKGDDNPDIEFYMGHFELMVGKRMGTQKFNALIRNNLRSDNRGAIQLDWTFPLWEATKLRGYVQYFNGYGESLIDYNARTNRLSVGVIMTEWF